MHVIFYYKIFKKLENYLLSKAFETIQKELPEAMRGRF